MRAFLLQKHFSRNSIPIGHLGEREFENKLDVSKGEGNIAYLLNIEFISELLEKSSLVVEALPIAGKEGFVSDEFVFLPVF